MNGVKKILSLILCGFTLCSVFAFTGCGANIGKVDNTVDLTEKARYDNRFGEDRIPSQYENFGVGDPFVMRHDGKYYLYCSAKAYTYGYKCWTSDDMINYTFLGDFNLLDINGNLFADDLDKSTAAAPEVYYYDGEFYMITSPRCKGHYVFKSVNSTPYGDYKALSEKPIDEGLYKYDGSVFIDDDENMYLLTPGTNTIRVYPFTDFETLGKEGYANKPSALNVKMPVTVEGPQVKKVNGTYYLTYAGNFVESKGYRVGYSYGKGDSLLSEPFEVAADNLLLLDTLGAQNGLGHCSTVLGPDLDSYYLSYHNLEEDENGFYRLYNVNRVSYGTNRMAVNHRDKGNIALELAEFFVYSDGTTYQGRNDALTADGDKFLSNKSTGNVFTVEYNFTNAGESRSLVFSSGENEGEISFGENSIILKIGGKTVAAATVNKNFDLSKLHTVTVSYANSKIKVTYEGITKIETTLSEPLNGGKIGYKGFTREEIRSTSFSSYAFGSSEKKAETITEGEFWNKNYVESASRVTGNSKTEYIGYDVNDDYSAYSDTSALTLKTAGDYATYKIDVEKDGYYGIDSLISVSSFGAVIGIQIDDSDPVVFTVNKVELDKSGKETGSLSKYVKTTVAEIRLTKGLHALTIILGKGEFSAIKTGIYESSEFRPEFSADLTKNVKNGSIYVTQYRIENGSHHAERYSSKMVLFGSRKLTDYAVSVDIKITKNAGLGKAGILLRADNPNFPLGANGSAGEAVTGYFVYINKDQVVLQRLSYGATTLASERSAISLNEYHTLKAEIKGNKITVSLDGKESVSFTDSYAYTHGLAGLFSVKTEAYYKNLKID